MKHVVIIALIAFVAACSDSEIPADKMDAPMNTVDADPSATCLVKPSFGALNAITGTRAMNGAANTATFVLDPGPPGKDDLFIKLTNVQTGTHPIAGADANYTTCTMCVTIIADIIPMQGPSKFYFANAGSVTIDQNGSTIAGNVSNLTFTEIDISDGSTIGTCTTAITSAMFTAQ